jgi:hypothetical protein
MLMKHWELVIGMHDFDNLEFAWSDGFVVVGRLRSDLQPVLQF